MNKRERNGTRHGEKKKHAIITNVEESSADLTILSFSCLTAVAAAVAAINR